MMDRCVKCSSYNVPTTDRWKYIDGYEEKYRVSDKGVIQHWDNNKKRWKTKTTRRNKDGYYYVRLSKSGEKKQEFVHRLVAIAFIKNPEKKETVHHKKRDKTCNCEYNLEWKTQKENNQAYEEEKNKKAQLY